MYLELHIVFRVDGVGCEPHYMVANGKTHYPCPQCTLINVVKWHSKDVHHLAQFGQHGCKCHNIDL